ncbi:MAG: hypothetical protein AABZ80_04785 [Gemmatimonadota bacterium]
MTKWIDNVLSHFVVVGVEQGTKGVERQLNGEAVLAISLCRLLSSELGVPLATAVSIGNHIVRTRTDADGKYEVAPGFSLQFSLTDIERQLHARLGDASESAPHVRRGRPQRLTNKAT